MKLRILCTKFIAALFALLVGPISAQACDMLKACNHINYCAYIQLDPTNESDRQNLLAALQRDDPPAIKDFTHKCQKHYGHEASWLSDGDDCPNETINQAGRSAKNTHCGSLFTPPPPPAPPVVYCYTQGKYYEIGNLGPVGTGICRDLGNGKCACGSSPGQIKRPNAKSNRVK
jgi:hypothetical protein